ncbi:MAG TPA: chromosomal replication initiator protein DnaA, partial [Syntrophomonas sp.]|nr:chromosomal replication initiator protein DnaA [Syntrophomonas sp.]
MTQEFNFSAIWNQVLQSLADEIDASSFDIWFSMVKFETVRNGRVYISVPNSLTKEWIESRYLGNLQNKLRSLTNQEIELILNTESQIE